jgi:glycosyltransferase involved in cell wall biosynthesis
LRLVSSLLETADDLWHAGLRLGLAARPRLIDFVSPNWLLNRDPSPDSEATSWRVSLRACLVRTTVLRQIGFLDRRFLTHEAAGLEWGHRCIQRGVLCRHQPRFAHSVEQDAAPLPAADELRFVLNRFGGRWAGWAVHRALLSGHWNLAESWRAIRSVFPDSAAVDTPIYRRLPAESSNRKDQEAKVSVLIPTIERYPYLDKLLSQLRNQTIPAHEILIVDQTPQPTRRPDMYAAFQDLPLRVIYQEQPGQSSARNAGLSAAQGDYILFLDDDDEVPADLIEKHLVNLWRFDAEASSGVAQEAGASPLHESFTLLRASDVFPTNNSMVRRSALQKTGLFDLAFDRGARADADLGMRLYLSGARMILDPDITVLHHHASQGGLRAHNARAITRESSRRHLLHRHLPSETEIYLLGRYFSPVQLREMLLIRILGTFSIRGTRLRRAFKVLLSILFLPQTLWTISKRRSAASRMLKDLPRIPTLRDLSEAHSYPGSLMRASSK